MFLLQVNTSSLLKSFHYVPSAINHDETPSDDALYSRWSKWSRCRRRCRQVRRRRCINTDRCGKTILKETRPCNRRRSCKNKSRVIHGKNKPKGKKPKRKRTNRRVTNVRSITGELQHIVRKKKLSKKSKGKLRKNNAFYSKWSKWSRCSDRCKTARTKVCNFETLCGFEKVEEEAYCYIKGSTCQSKHRQGNLSY